ncbi:MAG TPA: PilN domain-containing protein [Xanthomonadales bacterium]|nr:PilN domain-containing protein [Xanthomonadales bacterium]
MALALDTKLQEWRGRVQASPVNAYWRWWLGELRDLMPESWRARLQHALRRVTVEVGEKDVRIGIEENSEVRRLETFSLDQDADLQKQQLRELLADNELLEAPRVLYLDGAGVLRKEVRLPIAAETNLQQVLRFEMDRQTPFKADDVYFDWNVLGHDKEEGQVRIDLAVVPRSEIDTTTEMLTARGLGVSSVDVMDGDQPLGLNLLPPDRRVKVVNQKVRFNQIMSIVLVALIAVFMGVSLYLRSHQVAEYQAAIEEVRTEALRVQRIRDQISDTMESAGFLAERRSTTPMAVDVLADVTSTLPDDTYLDRLVVGQDTVQMQGKSQNAQQLIGLVNASPLLDEAGFRGSTRVDARTGLEIFEINANVVAVDAQETVSEPEAPEEG